MLLGVLVIETVLLTDFDGVIDEENETDIVLVAERDAKLVLDIVGLNDTLLVIDVDPVPLSLIDPVREVLGGGVEVMVIVTDPEGDVDFVVEVLSEILPVGESLSGIVLVGESDGLTVFVPLKDLELLALAGGARLTWALLYKLPLFISCIKPSTSL